jgi:prepilin-type N-terminal cleavage/methylation domain-containing protein/prepilin-type processing-associated H-X9-DG protein
MNQPNIGYRSSRRRDGFTLVELLVVIAVIAVLIGMLLPALSKARNQAQLIKCASNLHNQAIYLQMYQVQYKGQVPLGGNSGYTQMNYVIWDPGLSGGPGNYVGMGLLVPANIIKNTQPGDPPPGEAQIFYCPAADVAAGLSHTLNELPYNPWIGVAGMATRIQYSQRPEYLYLPSGNAATPWPGYKWSTTGSFASVRRTDAGVPASGNFWARGAAKLPTIGDFRHKALIMDLSTTQQHINYGHPKGVNVLYADWNVRFVSRLDLDQFYGPSRINRTQSTGNWDTISSGYTTQGRKYTNLMWLYLDSLQ